ncbi:MAG: hypothetical protein AUK63_553 [bacterium P3]|nr:MAG: hypothetical protein AUK63_553 [bacterium P3]KWW42009.1 MAG: hypothetical protein F083_660 [bacterium F083]
MKNIKYNFPRLQFFIVLTLLSGLGCQAQNTIDRQGRRQGHWVKTDKDGSKIYEGDFVDGHESGIFTYYYPNGTVRMRNTFTPDGRQCSHEAFDAQGRLMATGTFRQKNRDGEWRFYTEEGKLIKTAHYRMGVKDGLHIIFTRQGDTAEVTTWKDNRRDGRWWKRIGEQGHIEGTYRNGGLEGRVAEYGEQGELVREGHYVQGSRHGAYRYYENGRMTVDEEWDQGILADRKVLVMQPEAAYVSIFKIACLVPKGKQHVTVYTRRGEAVLTYEPAEDLYARIGSETFTLANRESRVMIATDCVTGLKKDAEGRDVLDTDPELPVAIYPDDDCKKMVESLQREGFEQ